MNRFGFCEDTLDDLIQRCIIHIWQHSLPRYDTREGTKVTTFIHYCAFNYFRLHMTRTYRRAQSEAESAPDEEFAERVAPEDGADHKIEELARSIIDNPEFFLTSVQAEVLTTIVNHPRLKMQEVAKMLGYTSACTLSHIMQRIRKRITDLDVEDHGK